MRSFIIALTFVLLAAAALGQTFAPIGPENSGVPLGPSGIGGGGGSGPPPPGCNGVIDASVGCPLPMLGM